MCTRSCFKGLGAVAAILGLVACGRLAETSDQRAARAAVTRYARALVDAYRAAKPEILQPVAGAPEVARVRRVISALAERGEFMEARPPKLRFIKIDVQPGPWAMVETEETWEYEHRALSDRARATGPKKARYRVLYRLQRQGGGWLVDQAVDEDLPGPQRPY